MTNEPVPEEQQESPPQRSRRPPVASRIRARPSIARPVLIRTIRLVEAEPALTIRQAQYLVTALMVYITGMIVLSTNILQDIRGFIQKKSRYRA